MAIDRGPWNALVDDDGSNLVGTVWNKDKIKTVILDPTDAALAAGNPWVDVPFSAANFSSVGGVGTWTVTAGQQVTFATRREGKTLWVAFYLQSTAVVNVNALRLNVPGGGPWRNQTALTVPMTISGVSLNTGLVLSIAGQSTLDLYRDFAATPIPTSTVTVAGTFGIPLA